MNTQEFIEKTGLKMITLAQPAHEFRPQSAKWVKQLGGEKSTETQYYKLRLQIGNRKFDFDYSQGCGHEKAPQIGAVLECLHMDATTETGSINDFMAEYGYTDAEGAQLIILLINKNRRGLKTMLGNHWNEFMTMEIEG